MDSLEGIARYFLQRSAERGEHLRMMKLQKLCYYAQGFHLALTDDPLFVEDFHAQPFGPVCRELYHEYSDAGPQPIAVPMAEHGLSSHTQEFLDIVLDRFEGYPGIVMSDLTHNEAPWQDAKARMKEGADSLITKDSLMAWFGPRIWQLSIEESPPPATDEDLAWLAENVDLEAP